MVESTTRRLMWCTTHGEPAWRYGDGSGACWYDCIVEGNSDHTLIELPSARADRLAELEAEVARLTDEVERLQRPSWDELLGYFDVIYPADVFTGVSGDPGPRLVVAIRELAAERALADELAAALQHEHAWADGDERLTGWTACPCCVALAKWREARQ